MTSTFSPQDHEATIYKLWEESGAFNPDTQQNVDASKDPYTILLPPPNANASLHAGHAMFVIEDILVRYHRMLGQPTLWLPGTDHAGFETQYVYEKHLSKQGKSRFQFDRETLYKDIHQFVRDNSGVIFDQLKQLGFSCDWSRSTFMLDKKVVNVVYDTFQKMVSDGLVYRDNYIVNYSPKSGTTFSDLEVKYVERKDALYYIKYGPFVIATARPETKFRDTAVAVHPDDPRYKEWIGKKIQFQSLLGMVEMDVIADEEMDMEFGTGVMKVTPAHDAHDFALGKRYNLPVTPIIDFSGRMDLSYFLTPENISSADPKYVARAQKYHGKKVMEARKLIVEDMIADGMMEKVDENYVHNVAVDYKTGGDIEPMVMPNWFVSTKEFAKPAIQAAKEKKVSFVPARFEQTYFQWMENIRDWPISRQIVWGIRIPVWYNIHENPLLHVTFLNSQKERVSGTVDELLHHSTTPISLEEIKAGLQTLRAPVGAKYIVSDASPGEDFLPETDTFDTWFSSGQWPLTTLGFPEGNDFKRFYPTQVLDTMWDILFFWVARMLMFGLYRTGEVPFSTVYLHSMVTDEKGAKMSKSKGNVINPIDLVQKYGADALRIALVAGSAPGNPIALSENKVRGYRNFSNKLWNIARFILLSKPEDVTTLTADRFTAEDSALLSELEKLVESTTTQLDTYRFSDAALGLYDFVWNRFASAYLEHTKTREDKEVTFYVLTTVFVTCLKLLHPFIPFVTEAIWQEWNHNELVTEKFLITSSWPSH